MDAIKNMCLMKDYTAYPEYKPSGIDWLGDVPKHWEAWKVTHGYSFIGSGSTPKSDDLCYYDGDINWVTTSELRETIIHDTNSKLTEEALRNYSSLKVYPVGTLLFAMYGATIGRLGILGVKATVNQACCAFVDPKVFVTEFVYYWLQMRRPTLIALSAGGGQPNLSQDDLKRIKIPVPSLGEQRIIADFLDEQMASFDTLIKKTEKQIKLLQEKRTALISHAVTKGLKPNAEYKPSGIDWLGDVPKRWEVKRLKNVCLINTDKLPDNTPDDYLIEYLDIGNVNSSGCVIGTEKLYFFEAPSRARRIVKSKDTIISTVRTYLKAVAFVSNPPENLIVSTGFAVLTACEGVTPEYLFFLILSKQFIERVVANSDGVAYPAINPTRMATLPAWLPSESEQKGITDFLFKETAKIDTLIKKNQQLVKKLTEKRTALIAAAVTGKMDVRQNN
ncbi:MAG: restriction endonuclease subunit S [Planctomycetes bacterium]|nr:restriction endonuclease subunit S [Planctomycetota bacterium]